MKEKDNNGNPHEMVVIHIGKERKESPNPTTGKALYNLGGVVSFPEIGPFKSRI